MKKLLLLATLLMSFAYQAQQILITQNTSSPNTCDGSAYVSDSLIVNSVNNWQYNGAILQTGGYFIDNLCPGTYILSYVSNGQTLLYTFIISTGTSNPCSGFTITGSSADPTAVNLCDGAAIITATGGTSPYTYTWDNGATTQQVNNLCPGYYICTVSDANGCNGSYTILIDQANPGGNGDTTVIFNNIDSTVFIIDSLGNNWVENCVLDFFDIDSVYVNGYGFNSPDTIFVNYVFVDSNGVVVLQLTSNYGVSNNNINGFYTTYLTLFCPQKSSQLKYVKVAQSLELIFNLGLNEGTIKPYTVVNPVQDELNLHLNTHKKVTLHLFDAQGKEVASKLNVQGQVVSLDVKHLIDGVYYLQIQMDGQMYHEKLIKY